MTSLSGYSEPQISHFLECGKLPNIDGYDCFKDRGLAELYIKHCKFPRKHKHDVNTNALRECLNFHPDLSDQIVENINHADILERFLLRQIIADFSEYALYINTLYEKGYIGKYYGRPEIFSAMANHAVGRQYIIDELQNVLENPKVEINHYKDAFKTIIEFDLQKIYDIVPKLLEFKHFNCGADLIEHAVRKHESFAHEMVEATEESPLIPNYSTKTARDYMGIHKTLKDQLRSIRATACYAHLSVAKKFVESRSVTILVAVVSHPELHRNVAWSKNIPNQHKADVIRISRNVEFAKLLKDNFDFYILIECILVSPDLKKYIMQERTNISPKLKQWLRSKGFERQDALDHARYEASAYRTAVKANARTRVPIRNV